MWRRLNREDLFDSNPLLARGERRHEFAWTVFNDYKLTEVDGKEPYLKASLDAGVSHGYEPLLDTPHLFLDFARLYEHRSRDRATLDWIGKYGLLGLETKLEWNPHADSDHFSMGGSLTEYSERGGPHETLTSIRNESHRANDALVLYEAALSGDVEKLERAIYIDGPTRGQYRIEVGGRDHLRQKAEWAGVAYAEFLVDMATRIVYDRVQGTLADFTYPCLSPRSPSGEPAGYDELWHPDLMASSLWPRNMLGAMYLQFFWLITSSGDLAHCRHCGRIIFYAPPVSAGKARKPRKDKEFCDSRCRQNYHYHNRIKPRRQTEQF
jgi:hypothetical protein